MFQPERRLLCSSNFSRQFVPLPPLLPPPLIKPSLPLPLHAPPFSVPSPLLHHAAAPTPFLRPCTAHCYRKPHPYLHLSMASRQRGPKPSDSLIDPAYYHKCDYQTSNSSAFADPQLVYSKTYKEKTIPELQQDLRAKPLLTGTSCVQQRALRVCITPGS